jgi:hypothetical protein
MHHIIRLMTLDTLISFRRGLIATLATECQNNSSTSVVALELQNSIQLCETELSQLPITPDRW